MSRFRLQGNEQSRAIAVGLVSPSGSEPAGWGLWSAYVAVAFAGWRKVPPDSNDERCERRVCKGEDPGRCLVENNAL